VTNERSALQGGAPTKVQDLMSKPAVTCRQTDTVNAAAELMWQFDCGAVPVTNDGGQLVGIITDRDICMATYTKGSSPLGISVCDAMSKQVFACHAGDSLAAAQQLMSEKQVHRLPVVDGENRPIGLLSLNDVVRHAASAPRKDGVERGVVETLAAVCQPRSSPMLSSALVRSPPSSATHLLVLQCSNRQRTIRS
jgi:CBS domain-containing protein